VGLRQIFFLSLCPSLTRRCANAPFAVACGKPLGVYLPHIVWRIFIQNWYQNLEAIALHITLHNFGKGDRTTDLQALKK
jgi:hypothetical protein